MKITKKQLKEMVRKVVKKQLNEGADYRFGLLGRLRSGGMSDEEILEELVRSMSDDEAKENFEHIGRMAGIDF